MEIRTPNDADDAGPFGQHQSASLGSCFSCQVSRLPVPNETGLVCIAQARPYKMCMLHGFWAFCPYVQHFCGSEACPMRETWLLLAADLQQKNANVGWNMVSLHREPCLKSSLMAFLGFLAPPGPNQAKMGSLLCS